MPPAPFEMKDRFGVTWIVKPRLPKGMPESAGVFAFDVALLNQQAYNTEPQRVVIVVNAKSSDAAVKIAEEINAYITDHLASGGQPPARGTLDVNAKPDSGAWLLILVAVLVMSKKGRR